MPGYPPPGYGQAPQAGAYGYYQPGAGFPAPVQPRRRYRAALIIGIAVVVVVVVVVVLTLVVARTPKGSVTFPALCLA